jgi:AraC-like DNA-binding protein
MQPLLERRAILHSRDFARAEAFLAARHIAAELNGSARERAAFEVHFNGVYLPGVWLGYISYGSAVTARVLPSRGDFWVHIPLHGVLQSTVGRQRVEGDAARGVLTSPCDVNVVRSAPGTARLSLCIKGDALTRHLEMLIDRPAQAPLEFAPEIDLRGGFGLCLAGMLRGAAADLDCRDWLLRPLLASRFEQSIFDALLMSQPHNYLHLLRECTPGIAPRDVGRVVDYMHANLAAPITLADLVRESGVAGRTLLQHFRHFKGVPPMRYLRDLRLRRVRAELESGRATRVSETAMRWGFAHAGRFSVEYRQRFGESPSQTLMRRRGRA